MARLCFIRPRRPLLGLVASLVGAGCTGGGQTGGEDPEEVPGATPASPQCAIVRTPIAFDAVTPLGLSAEQLVAPWLVTHRSALLWRADTAPVTVAPEQGESSIELALSYGGGNAAWVHFEEPPRSDAGTGATMNGAATTAVALGGDGTAPTESPPLVAAAPSVPPEAPGAPSVPPCPRDRLEVDVSALLRTGGGAFDEAFTATLQVLALDTARLDRELAVDQLTGSLAVSAPAGVSAGSLRLSAAWDAAGFRGSVAGNVSSRTAGGDPGVVGFGLIEYASWPLPPGGASP
jgi:hypothetical protein